MALELIRTRPTIDQYTPLSEHQEQTPGTFFGGKPVLYYHTTDAQLNVDKHTLCQNAALSALQGTANITLSTTTNGNSGPEQVTLPDIDVFVTSSAFVIFSTQSSTGISIPYPLISLHAQQASALYMQLILSDSRHTADEDLETVELLVSPSSTSTTTSTTSSATDGQASNEAEALFAAVSSCADLHPDPTSSDEEGDGNEMDMAAPGTGGWITSENMAQFMDAEGNLDFSRMQSLGDEGEPLGEGIGEGAGRVRTADEMAGEEVDVHEIGEGAGQGEDETKWRRTG